MTAFVGNPIMSLMGIHTPLGPLRPNSPFHARHLTATRLHTIHTLLNGYSSLSVAQLLKPLSSDFAHRVLPASLAMPLRNRDEFASHAAAIFSIFSAFAMLPDAIYEDEAQGVVVVHARMEGVLKSTGGVWNNECVMMVRLSRDGKEVVEIREFVDGLKAAEMRAKHAPKEFGEKVVEERVVVRERRMSC